MAANKGVAVPANLPQMARETSPDHPWPLRLLNAKIAEYIAKMSRLWVEGEIITLTRRPGAKVQFFSLADLEEKSSITCKIFSHALPEGIESGSRVIVWAKPDFWTGNGSLALHVDEIRAVGLGDILARIEALKNKLAAEGLFAANRKKPLPFLPHSIGLIVGRNTKARHDVEVNARARWASAKFEVCEVVVQGPTAVNEIISALEELDTLPHVDVIVIARGGGSVEDLLPFSDERLLRAVAKANTPIVSAIGHETDNPLLDFVADLRGSTPTDAARKIVPDVVEEQTNIREALRRGRIAIDTLLTQAHTDLETQRSRPALTQPQTLIDMREKDLHQLRQWLINNTDRILTKHSALIDTHLARLRTLSPLSTLQRGYAVLRTESGVLTSTTNVTIGDTIHAQLIDGTISATITASERTDR
ncbi:exodeoxyribonuclease VII large subunit [Arcanobacterium buesumense]|uniref:Exodeoxyribonuclease 7 large subunit n=1 Tax=Arcanobacterium buesumense TaxID=2722751 RepID=A0A6H2EMW4_9ACTO|nr:exodeoxyribonuclease VII large subunit [Arcanobacterium buesumense]QJC22392.1 exodeoxyribonuclease VII large subunit [Arcanobacterium buesumense]